MDEMDISVVNPSGERVGPFREILGSQRFLLGNTELLIYYGEPKPYSVRQEIYISFLPVQSYVDSGVWQIILTPKRIVDGAYQMWLMTRGRSPTRTFPAGDRLRFTRAAMCRNLTWQLQG